MRRHVVVVLLLAVGVAVVALAALWLLLGMPQLAVNEPLKTGDVYDAVKIALAVVAGVGGVVALVVTYRRQQLSEAGEVREQSKAMTERFGAAAEQLSAERPGTRMAGAYAMARLADDWPEHRQTCVDVLCGYLRMPHASVPPDDEQALAAWRSERAVRLTVLRLIAAHLRDDSQHDWRGHDLDFTGVVLDEADFRGVRFVGGKIIFIVTLFVSRGFDHVIFDEVEFGEGCSVYFRVAEFAAVTFGSTGPDSQAAG